MNALMTAALDPSAIAKEPTQARAKQRFEAVLAEAERMLAADGISKFSIPVLAQRLKMTRGSVYAYFPTHYAILNELAQRYMAELEASYVEHADEIANLRWKDSVRKVVERAVAFHNQQPVACLLILGGAVTDSSFRAQEALIRRLGNLGRAIWEQQSGEKLQSSPDVVTLAVDMAVSCFRRSVLEHGEITPAYADMAVQAMTRFLEPYFDISKAGKPKTKRAKLR